MAQLKERCIHLEIKSSSEAAISSELEDLKQILEAVSGSVTIFADMRSAGRPGARARLLISNFLAENEPLLDLRVDAWAIVMSSIINHLVNTAISVGHRPGYSRRFFLSKSKALDWLITFDCSTN